jgi:hypothetical protein
MKRPFSDHSFEMFLGEEKLMGSKCEKCGKTYCPPRALCIECYATDLSWTEMPETGKLAAYTCITVPTPAMMALGYDRKNPYCCGVVEIAPGVRMDARIEGVDANDPASISVGMKLKTQFLHQGEGEARTSFVAYRPA